MEELKNNFPHLTAIHRTDLSVPTRHLKSRGLLKGRILDFGCGFGFDTDELSRQGFDITGYDNYYRPDYPQGKFDTIICNYVLNVLQPYDQRDVILNVTNLLASDGCAYFAVRRDLPEEGFRFHPIHKVNTYQCLVRLPFESMLCNGSFELYKFRHFNFLPRKGGVFCNFCNLSRKVEIICETPNCVAFFDGYPASPGHALIMLKRHAESYFDLTRAEMDEMNQTLLFAKKKIDERFHPDGYNIGVNDGVAAGASVQHAHIHLIPRYNGDVPNPKGGVRAIVACKK